MGELNRALGVAIDEDLKPLSALLHQRGVAHRIFEEGGQQVLMVEGAEQAEQVRALYDAWRAGEVRIEAVRGFGPAKADPRGQAKPESTCAGAGQKPPSFNCL